MWHRDSRTSHGFRTDACISCRQQREQEEDKEEINRRYEELMKQGFKTLDEMSKLSSEIPHIGEVYQNIMKIFGGAPGFAKQVALHILSAKPGSMTKQKSLEMMMRLSVKVSESGAAQKSFQELSDEELQEEVRRSTGTLRIAEGDSLAG